MPRTAPRGIAIAPARGQMRQILVGDDRLLTWWCCSNRAPAAARNVRSRDACGVMECVASTHRAVIARIAALRRPRAPVARSLWSLSAPSTARWQDPSDLQNETETELQSGRGGCGILISQDKGTFQLLRNGPISRAKLCNSRLLGCYGLGGRAGTFFVALLAALTLPPRSVSVVGLTSREAPGVGSMHHGQNLPFVALVSIWATARHRGVEGHANGPASLGCGGANVTIRNSSASEPLMMAERRRGSRFLRDLAPTNPGNLGPNAAWGAHRRGGRQEVGRNGDDVHFVAAHSRLPWKPVRRVVDVDRRRSSEPGGCGACRAA